MLHEIPYHYFTPPLTKQKKNENWQIATHPANLINSIPNLPLLIDLLMNDTIQHKCKIV